MSNSRLRAITVRLEEITGELGAGDSDDARAAQLAHEAAELAAEAVEETNRLMRESSTE